MLTVEERKIITEYAQNVSGSDGWVNFEFLNKRVLRELSIDCVRVTDYVFFLENDRDYGCAMRHPREALCFPLLIDHVTIKMDLRIGRNKQFEIVGEEVSLKYDSFFISDKEVPNKLIAALLADRYFDKRYQEFCPDLKKYLVRFFKAKHVEKTERFKARIAPFIGFGDGKHKPKNLSMMN